MVCNMSEIIYKKVLLISLLISILVFSTGCLLDNQDAGSGPGIQGANAKYYTGREGVEATYENLPYRVYYYAGGTEDENSFSFNVKVHNEGTSLARGATFISGYDPNILLIEGQPISKTDNQGSCSIDVTSLGESFSDWGGYLSCAFLNGSAFDFQTNEGAWNLGLNNVGNALTELGIWETPNWLTDLDLTLTGEDGHGVQGFSFNFDAPSGFDIKMMYHGNYLSALIEKTMPFKSGFGREYLLAADNQYYPNGEMDYIDYHVNIKSWPRALEEYPITLLLTNCYGYATFTSPLVCIDPQPMSERRKACVPRDIILSTQGAPVAVTKIEQESTMKKSIFTIHIRNVGSGEIIYWGDLNKCSPYAKNQILTSKNKNIVQGFEARIENKVLKCTPSDRKIRLNPNGEGIITCMYDLEYTNLQSAYQTPLIIEFWYGYMETGSQNVLFKKII